jgi:hypothetical protein
LIQHYCDLPFVGNGPARLTRDPARPLCGAAHYERMDDRMVNSPQHKVSGFVDAAEGAG